MSLRFRLVQSINGNECAAPSPLFRGRRVAQTAEAARDDDDPSAAGDGDHEAPVGSRQNEERALRTQSGRGGGGFMGFESSSKLKKIHFFASIY